MRQEDLAARALDSAKRETQIDLIQRNAQREKPFFAYYAGKASCAGILAMVEAAAKDNTK